MESSICKNLLSKIHNNEKYVLNNISQVLEEEHSVSV